MVTSPSQAKAVILKLGDHSEVTNRLDYKNECEHETWNQGRGVQIINTCQGNWKWSLLRGSKRKRKRNSRLADATFMIPKNGTRTVARENSWHCVFLPLIFPRNDVWETSAEKPYWWRLTTETWVVLLIGRAVTGHQYVIFTLVSQTSFRGQTSGGVAKCRLDYE